MKSVRVLRSLLAAVVLVSLGACGGRWPGEPVVETFETQETYGPVSESELEVARARWGASEIDTYQYRFHWSCWCGDRGRQVDVQVSHGNVVGAIDVETGEPLVGDALERYRTIEELFAFVQSALDRPADSVNGAFDPRRGFPATMFVDYDFGMADEENGFVIESLTTLPR